MIKVKDLGNYLDIDRLIGYLLREPWHEDCIIIPEYMPPHPREDTRPTLQIHFNFDDQYVGLRHSKGPRQGFSWDCYGDDFQNMELALIALSQAPMPQRACITFKLPLGKKETGVKNEVQADN